MYSLIIGILLMPDFVSIFPKMLYFAGGAEKL